MISMTTDVPCLSAEADGGHEKHSERGKKSTSAADGGDGN
jgi:hypothetical protein